MFIKQKDDLLFIGLIFAISFAGIIMIIQSQKYNDSLIKINPNYFFPSFFEIVIYTAILTFILFILKLTLEKIFFYFNEGILLEKYKNKENQLEKNKYKRKLAIYGVKFFHYLFITIHSFFSKRIIWSWKYEKFI